MTTYTCDHCGDEFDEELEYGLCEYCYENTTECDNCRSLVYIDDVIEVNTRNRYTDRYCSDCVTHNDRVHRCDDCGEYFRDSLTLYHIDGFTYCERCANDHVTFCDGCSGIIWQDEAHYTAYKVYCRDCMECDGIHEYEYIPTIQFLGDDSKRYYGIEIEFEFNGNERDVSYLADREHQFWLTRDISLDDGAEITSQPATLAYHLNDFGWSDILNHAADQGWRSHDTTTCGMHIHVTRASISEITQAKLAFFVHNNQEFMELVARRTNNSIYAYYVKKDKLDHSPDKFINNRRGEVLNWTEQTIEFRMFRGTLRVETLYATLQFVEALLTWLTAVSADRLVFEPKKCLLSFRSYLQMDWPDVHTYIREREANVSTDR